MLTAGMGGTPGVRSLILRLLILLILLQILHAYPRSKRNHGNIQDKTLQSLKNVLLELYSKKEHTKNTKVSGSIKEHIHSPPVTQPIAPPEENPSEDDLTRRRLKDACNKDLGDTRLCTMISKLVPESAADDKTKTLVAIEDGEKPEKEDGEEVDQTPDVRVSSDEESFDRGNDKDMTRRRPKHACNMDLPDDHLCTLLNKLMSESASAAGQMTSVPIEDEEQEKEDGEEVDQTPDVRGLRAPSDIETFDRNNDNDLDPNSMLAHTLMAEQVDIHGETFKPTGLDVEKTYKAFGDKHDNHPTRKPPTETDEAELSSHQVVSTAGGLLVPEVDTNLRRDAIKRNFLSDNTILWPQGIVPYDVDTSAFTTDDIAIIEDAINEMASLTCVTFKKRSEVDISAIGHYTYIRFISGSGCWSYVGRLFPEVQNISLGSGCIHKVTALHEMCHAIGQKHEQSRYDRDRHIEMIWGNIDGAKTNTNMEKTHTKDVNSYDYGSLMQYDLKTAAIDDAKYTMRFRDRQLEFLADSATGLTFYDIKDINAAYKCADKCGSDVPTCQNGGYIYTTCNCLCPAGFTGPDCSGIKTDSGCGGIVDVSSGPQHIISSNYPNNYDTGSKCAWLVKGPVGTLVKLTINELKLSYISWNNTCQHWLEMRYNLIGQTGLRKCGDTSNEVYTRTWDGNPNLMYLNFDSMSFATASKGFALTVESIPPGCDSSPCIHGTCQEDQTTLYQCVCEINFEGVHCDQIKASASFSCSFESADSCIFTNVYIGDDFDWTRHQGSTLSSGTGPTVAHTGTYYMYAEVSWRNEGDKTRLVSLYALPAQNWCMTFWYHMYGNTVGKFAVFGEVDNAELWSKSEDLGTDWQDAKITLTLSKKQKIVLEATVGSSFRGDIGIDDLTLVAGTCVHPCDSSPCKNQGTCTNSGSTYGCACIDTWKGTTCETPVNPIVTCSFEDGETDYQFVNGQGDGFDWTRHSGCTNSLGTGPCAASDGDEYMYIEADGVAAGAYASLESDFNLKHGNRCLTFDYHMYGNPSYLSVWTREIGEQWTFLWFKYGNQGNQWNKATIDITTTSSTKLSIDGERGPWTTSWQGDIAIDYIQISSFPCFQACGLSPCKNGGACTNSDSTTFSCACTSTWTGDTCDTPVPIQPCDSSPCKNGGACTNSGTTFICSCTSTWKGATCETPVLPCDTSPCKNGGTCTNSGSTFSCACTSTWSGPICETQVRPCDSSPCKNGGTCANSGTTFSCACTSTWTGATCKTEVQPCDSLPCKNGGSCTNSGSTFGCACTNAWTGATCETHVHPCDSSPCKNGGSCINSGSIFSCVCTKGWIGSTCESSLNQWIEGKCHFEDTSHCFLEQVASDDLDWVMSHTGNTRTGTTGPDGAIQGSSYGYLESSYPALAMQSAILMSSSAYPAGDYCLTFSYHMSGLLMGSLSVVVEEESTVDAHEVFYKRGDHGPQWNNAVVPLRTGGGFKVLFEAVRGSGYSSDIALDDVSFYSVGCGCHSSPCLNGGVCGNNGANHYTCTCMAGFSGIICEQVAAAAILVCSFEPNTPCFLQQSHKDDFDWTVTEGPTPSSGTGPSAAAEGSHYAYIETSGLSLNGDKAQYTTSPMAFAAADRCMKFKYSMRGSNLGSLTVYKDDMPVFSKSTATGEEWMEAIVDISLSGHSELTIDATDQGNFGDIAIDDVILAPGTC